KCGSSGAGLYKMYRTGVLNTLSIQQIEQIVKKNLCWQRQRLCFCGELCYNERKRKASAA
ncbi:MAG: hypothetical protein ACLVB3_09310, partial [Clostridium sp.]